MLNEFKPPKGFEKQLIPKDTPPTKKPSEVWMFRLSPEVPVDKLNNIDIPLDALNKESLEWNAPLVTFEIPSTTKGKESQEYGIYPCLPDQGVTTDEMTQLHILMPQSKTYQLYEPPKIRYFRLGHTQSSKKSIQKKLKKNGEQLLKEPYQPPQPPRHLLELYASQKQEHVSSTTKEKRSNDQKDQKEKPPKKKKKTT